MLLELVLTLLTAVPSAPSGAVPGVPSVRALDDLSEAEAAFRQSLTRTDLAARQAALANLVAVGDARAMATLTGEYARAHRSLRESRDAAFRARYTIQAKERVLADLERRAQEDSELRDALRSTRTDLEAARETLERADEKVAVEGPWVASLAAGARELCDGQSAGKRKGVEKTLWKDAETHPDWGLRLASVALLGEIGAPGTALKLQELLGEAFQERAKIERNLPKVEKDVREFERKMQDDAREGKVSVDLTQYQRVQAEARALRTTYVEIGWFADAVVLAGAAALAREEGDTLARSLSTFVRNLGKAKDGARLRTLELLALADAEPVRAHTRQLLLGEREPAAIAQLLDDLARLGDQQIVDDLIAKYLVHESWHVRARAAAALATLRARPGIPALIDRLETVEGRERTDVTQALVALTGKDFKSSHPAWKRWWEAEGEGFVLPEPGAEAEVSEGVADTVGVTFFGIRTDSQRVLFVLDTSGSMNWSMVIRSNPYDDARRPPDMPKRGELSRLEAAKMDLKKALGGLRDGALFNLVVYASDVWTWQKDVAVMDPELRNEVNTYVDGLVAVGGTNMFGALREAFELAGAKAGDSWGEPRIDTIFLLTDGTPTVGSTTDADEILAHVREWNRSAGIVLHTIGLSGAQDAYLLRNLAEQNGGTYAAR